jgi:hypothetical protein
VKPLLAVLAVVAVGLVLVLVHQWRLGSAVLGLALSLAAALRLVLPEGHAGLLVVRSRAVDAAVLVALGFLLVGLANSIPSGR